MFWTYEHEAILYTGLRIHRKLFHCGTERQEVLKNTSRSKGISLFSTRKSALHAFPLGLYLRAITFDTQSEEKEDYSACMLRKAEQTSTMISSIKHKQKHFMDFLK